MLDERSEWKRGGAWVGVVGSIAVLTAHVAVVAMDSHGVVVAPISSLSRSDHGHWHSLGLVAFALAQVGTAVALGAVDRGRLWQLGRLLLAVAGAGVLFVAGYFAVADHGQLGGDHANDPLSVLASIVGVSMAALQPGWSRRTRVMAWFNGLCLTVWLALVLALLLVDDSWLGAYERLVGGCYVLWVLGLSLHAGSRRLEVGASAS